MKQIKILLVLCYGAAMQAQGGSAATQLLMLDPASGGAITAAGSYFLNYDIMNTITIETSNVTLDLNGHTITGCIDIPSGNNNICIHNGIITSGAFGILIDDDTNNIKIDNVTILNVTTVPGIQVGSVENLFISNCLVSGSTFDGCRLNESKSVIINNCSFFDNQGHGLFINDAVNVNVIDCYASNNMLDGYFVAQEDAKDILFTDCVANLNMVNGFAGSPFQAINCIADSNTQHGFVLSSFFAVLIEDCVAQNNMLDGFLTLSPAANVIQESVAFSNKRNGFNNDSGGSASRYVNNYAYNNVTNYVNVSNTTNSSNAQFWLNVFDN